MIQTTLVNIKDVKLNPNNPRIIKDDKFYKLVKSIQQFPKMLEIRPVVVNDDMIVLGGNMRLKACKEAGLQQIPIIKASDLTEDEQREFIIKDNVGFGDWDWTILQQEWDMSKLQEWDLELPGFDIDEDGFTDDFTLKAKDKNPLQQWTITLSTEQFQKIMDVIDEIKKTEEYKYIETFGNHNPNGNALYFLVTKWDEQKKYK